MKHLKQTALGLMLLCLVACSTPSPQTILQRPNPEWTEAVPEPLLQGKTNGDLAAWAKALREALAQANASLAAVRRWAEGQ